MHMLFISISFFMHWLWPPEHFWKEVLRSYILALFPIWGYKNLQYNIKYVLNIPTNPKGNQPWVLIGRTDAEAEAPILWPPDGKSWLVGEDPDAGKDWRQKEKGVAEDEMVREHHQLNGHESEQTPGENEGQGAGMLQSMGSQSWTQLSD